MAKNSTKDRRDSQVQRITTVDNPSQGGNIVYVVGLGLILVAGIAAIVFVSQNRESNLGVAPEASIDHWHSAFTINNCGVDLPPTSNFAAPAGLHTHGDGLLHIHPFSPAVSGSNATVGAFFEAYDAEVTDESFTSGFADPVPTTLSEADGCGGEDATLQLAVWDNPFLPDEEPRIITENIADYHFDRGGQAITLALVPDGSEIPRPPQDRLNQLLETGPGDIENPIEFPEVATDDTAEDTADEDGSHDANTDAEEGAEDDAEAEEDAEDDADAGTNE